MPLNKHLILAVLWLICLSISGFAQPKSETISLFEPYMSEEKAKEGLAKLDSFLTFNPTNVDALVLRGNFIFLINKAEEGGVVFNAQLNEDIYDTESNYIQPSQYIPSDSAATEITNTWLKALQIEPQREDVWFGVAQIYALSLNTKKLIDFLPEIHTNIPIKQINAVDYADYASIFIHHGLFEEGIKVYKAINKLYGGNASILNSIAGEFYYEGQLDSAIYYTEKALQYEQYDITSYNNAFFFYALNQQEEKALDMLQEADKRSKEKSALTYQALLEFYKGEKYFKTARKALKVKDRDTNADSLLRTLSLQKIHFTDSVNAIFYNAQLSDAHKLLINKALIKFQDSFDAKFNAAEILTYHKNYKAACAIYETIDTTNCGVQQLDDYRFYYAWALYKSNKMSEAHNQWLQLINSTNFYFRSAAVYFLGKYYLSLGNKKAAQSFFESVAEFSNESKYANLCLIELNQL